MELEIYHYSLCASLTLLIFFSYRFIFGKLPKKENYRPYRQSRMLSGFAMLMLSANYMVHMFATPRLTSPMLAILMNLCTYWIAVTLFGSALMMLLDRRHLTKERFKRHLAAWVVYCLLTHLMWRYTPEGLLRKLMPFILAILFIIYAVKVARRIFITFRKAKQKLDDYYSEDSEAYIRWMSVFTYWAIIFGVGQGLFTFVPSKYVFVWIISAIPFYIYLYTSYANYFLFYENVEGALAVDEGSEYADSTTNSNKKEDKPSGSQERSIGMAKVQETILERQLKKWTDEKKFTTGGVTIEDVARETGTNRTYISSFINSHYSMSFREWINELRLEYAKELMRNNPELAMREVARLAGYLSLSYFTKTFKEAEGVTPGRWNKD